MAESDQACALYQQLVRHVQKCAAEEYWRIMDERAAARQRENDRLGAPPDDDEWPFSQN
jgi:hypothetical protein